MRQAVNLYQPIFRTPRKVFGATMLAQMLGGALIALALMYGWSYWRLHTLTAEVARLSAARVTAHARLDSLRQAYPARQSNPLLAQELLRVSNEMERARSLAGVLGQGAFSNTSGLSPYLLGFARQHVDGTWLTHVTIADGGSHIALEGRALRPALIPDFVQRLTGEAAFQGKSFSGLKLERDDDAREGIGFTITTEEAATVAQTDEHG
ncbi:MAG: PilN domain-containing protein [Gammaproteobacteria bacterium]|nr:PilN domain-containing protein [Gammaproteobacteria bacterium]